MNLFIRAIIIIYQSYHYFNPHKNLSRNYTNHCYLNFSNEQEPPIDMEITTYIYAAEPFWTGSTSSTTSLCWKCSSRCFFLKYKSSMHSLNFIIQKRKPINRVNFSENCNESEKAYIFTKFSLSFSFEPVTRFKWTSTDHFKWWCQKCAEWEFKGLTGSAT